VEVDGMERARPRLQNSVLALAGLILIHMPSDYWRRPDTAPRDIG
jgi:hypothetical protein